jgi:surface polysaccharide O-acyltransferase-like enzyme
VNKTKKNQGVSSTQRFIWADIIRIIAIFLVIQIHALSQLATVEWQASVIIKLSVISVPLFILLSGVLLLGKIESYKTFFQKRFFKVLLPWFFWTIIYMYFDLSIKHNALPIKDVVSAGYMTLTQWFHYFITSFLSRLWFLPLIFGLYLITPIGRIFTKHAEKKDAIYCILLWFIFASVMPFIFSNALFPKYEPSLLLAPFQYIGLFLLGYFILQWKVRINQYILLAITIFSLCIRFLPFNHQFIQTFSTGFLDPGTVIAAFTFFLFLYQIANRFEKNIGRKTRAVIMLVSKASFGVYLIHEIIVYFVTPLMPYLKHLHIELLFSMIVFMVAIIVVVVLQRIPLIKYIVP